MPTTMACNPPGAARANHERCPGYNNNGDICECQHHAGDPDTKLAAAADAARAIRERNAAAVLAFGRD